MMVLSPDAAPGDADAADSTGIEIHRVAAMPAVFTLKNFASKKECA